MSSTHGIIPGGNELPCDVPACVWLFSWLLDPLDAGSFWFVGSMFVYADCAVGYDAVLRGRETLAAAGDTRPNGLKVDWGVLGLVSWGFGLVRGPGPALVLLECRLGVECSGTGAGGCVPVRDTIGRRPASSGNGALEEGRRGPIRCSW